MDRWPWKGSKAGRAGGVHDRPAADRRVDDWSRSVALNGQGVYHQGHNHVAGEDAGVYDQGHRSYCGCGQGVYHQGHWSSSGRGVGVYHQGTPYPTE